MNRIKEFFLFCSGVDRSMLAQVPSDENKYLGIGGTIFFTGVLAFFSSAYALYYIFDSWLAAVVFGVIWGLMIFNLDRYIVSSMKSRGGFFGNLAVATPRLLMAVLLALVISKPLELKIFEKEINAELIVMEQEVYKTQEDRIQARYAGQIAGYETDNQRLQAEIDAATANRDAKVTAALAEADGSGGSKIRNMGPIYRAKRAEADQAEAELVTIRTENEPIIQANRAEIALLQDKVGEEIASLQRGSYGGIAARIDALDRLGQESPAIYLASLFVMLLFIAVETAPIFTKLISPRSPYDHLLNDHEHVYTMAAKESMTERTNDVKNRLRIHGEVGLYRAKSEIAAQKSEIDHELQQRLDRLRGRGLELR
jgi:hypothetical protein